MTVKTANRESTGDKQSISLFLPMPQPNLRATCARISEPAASIISCVREGSHVNPPHPTPDGDEERVETYSGLERAVQIESTEPTPWPFQRPL